MMNVWPVIRERDILNSLRKLRENAAGFLRTESLSITPVGHMDVEP